MRFQPPGNSTWGGNDQVGRVIHFSKLSSCKALHFSKARGPVADADSGHLREMYLDKADLPQKAAFDSRCQHGKKWKKGWFLKERPNSDRWPSLSCRRVSRNWHLLSKNRTCAVHNDPLSIAQQLVPIGAPSGRKRQHEAAPCGFPPQVLVCCHMGEGNCKSWLSRPPPGDQCLRRRSGKAGLPTTINQRQPLSQSRT